MSASASLWPQQLKTEAGIQGLEWMRSQGEKDTRIAGTMGTVLDHYNMIQGKQIVPRKTVHKP